MTSRRQVASTKIQLALVGVLNRIESQPSNQNATREGYYTWRSILHYDVTHFLNMRPSRIVCVVYTCNYKNPALDDLLGSTSTSWYDPLEMSKCIDTTCTVTTGKMYVEQYPQKMRIHFVMRYYLKKPLDLISIIGIIRINRSASQFRRRS